MKFEPENLLASVQDVFSVFLPGAIFTFLISGFIGPKIFGPIFPEYYGETADTAVFLVSSYILGHFIFLIGAILDNVLYVPVRKATADEQALLEKRITAETVPAELEHLKKKRATRFSKWLAKIFFPKNADIAVSQVIALKEKKIHDQPRSSNQDPQPAINAFQWAKSKLALECPESLAELQRFEADSKFFRSFTIVLFFLLAWICVQAFKGEASWFLAIACLITLLLSCWRYVERRFKSTQQAYWHILTLELTPSSIKGASNSGP